MAVLNEEQEMLRDMAREWTVNESPVTEFRKVRASGEPEAFNRDAYATMAQMGWAGVIIPEEHGGSDFGFLSAGLVVEELGKTLTASPLVMNTVAASAIVLGGSDEQKATYLPKLGEGSWTGTMCLTEPQAGTDLGIRAPRPSRKKMATTPSPGKRFSFLQATMIWPTISSTLCWLKFRTDQKGSRVCRFSLYQSSW